jgi:FO synthase
MEIINGASRTGMSIRDWLIKARESGLDSIPGTAAEILDDPIREIQCPDKIDTGEWLEAHRIAHSVGLRSNVTIMFGAVESPVSWARHMIRTRDLQKETGGFTEFVPLPFVHMASPIYLKRSARRGPTFRETLLMHAVGRLALHPWIENVQVSWVKAGPQGAVEALNAGVNDLGGTLMNESISRAAGSEWGQELTPQRMEELIRSAGRVPRQRTTLYGDAPAEQVARSFAAAPLAEPWNPHVSESRLARAGRLVRPA